MNTGSCETSVAVPMEVDCFEQVEDSINHQITATANHKHTVHRKPFLQLSVRQRNILNELKSRLMMTIHEFCGVHNFTANGADSHALVVSALQSTWKECSTHSSSGGVEVEVGIVDDLNEIGEVTSCAQDLSSVQPLSLTNFRDNQICRDKPFLDIEESFISHYHKTTPFQRSLLLKMLDCYLLQFISFIGKNVTHILENDTFTRYFPFRFFFDSENIFALLLFALKTSLVEYYCHL